MARYGTKRYSQTHQDLLVNHKAGSTRSDPLNFNKLRGESLVTYVAKFGGVIIREALKMSGRGWSKSPGFRDFTLRFPVSKSIGGRTA
jgi:hypothetical protein